MTTSNVPEQDRLADAVVRGLGEGAGAGDSTAAIIEPVSRDLPVWDLEHKELHSPLEAFLQIAFAGTSDRSEFMASLGRVSIAVPMTASALRAVAFRVLFAREPVAVLVEAISAIVRRGQLIGPSTADGRASALACRTPRYAPMKSWRVSVSWTPRLSNVSLVTSVVDLSSY